MIKLVALDIDGTLTSTDGSISGENIEAVKQVLLKGIYTVLASARPPQGVDAVADLFGESIYRVSYSGAVIQTPTRIELQRLLIDIDVARDIAHFADLNRFSLTVTINDIEYHTQSQLRETLVPHLSIDLAQKAIDEEGAPLLIGVSGQQPTTSLYEYCQERHGKSVYMPRHFRSDGVLDSLVILHPEAQKGKALIALCNLLSIAPEEMLAIGDSESDLPMFQVAGLSVAVGNATPAIQQAATLVAPSANDNAVAWALQRLL